MTQQKTKSAAARKAAAARTEKTNTDAHVFEWRGHKLTLPDRLPATVAFDLAELQEPGNQSMSPMFRFLAGLIGTEQLALVRDQIAKDGDALDELEQILAELLDGVLGAFGMNLGE